MTITKELLLQMGFIEDMFNHYQLNFNVNIDGEERRYQIRIHLKEDIVYIELYNFNMPPTPIETISDMISTICKYFIIVGEDKKVNEIKKILSLK